MSIVEKSDEWFMSRIVEPFSWWCEYRYEIGHAQLARLANGLSFIAFSLQSIINGELLGVLFTLLVWYFFVDRSYGVDVEHRARIAEGALNPRRYQWVARMVLLVIIGTLLTCLAMVMVWIFPISKAAFITSYFFTVLQIYFECANPLPPWYRQKKEREAAERSMRTQQM